MSSSAISCVFAIILSFYGITCHHNQQIRITNGNDDEQPIYKPQVGFTACHTRSATYMANETVIYDRVITNIGYDFDADTGMFEAPADGLYFFTFTGMAYGSTSLYLRLIKDGSYIAEVYSNLNWGDSATNSANLYLQTGDKVWIEVGYNTGHLHTSDYNCFSGFLVR